MMPGFLILVTRQHPPFTVIASGGGGGESRSREVRRKARDDLDRWSIILLEIFNSQIEIKREIRIGKILETSFEFETWNKYP